ncbi:cell wall-binding repeat-containing protein [Haloimpatiens sp. FM7315]|uniref:cell wall-binding repeat-containing protein n=1 Tax=Haloimpatiens sp. FM7315 TaxID=3298609 RepID=UPI0035A3D462
MKKGKLIALVALVTILSSSTCVKAQEVTANEKATVNTKRIQGINRYITSVEVSKVGWNSGSQNVILASGENFPDALCAVPLSKKFDAPILLSGKDYIAEETLKEIQRLKPKKIFIMGLDGSISKEIENKVKKSVANLEVERVGGKDRYETSVKAAEKINSSKAVITSGENYADALSIASIAAQMDMPIVLSCKESIPSKAQEYIKSRNIKEAMLIGGEGVLSKNIENKFAKVERIGGLDRYETNSKIVNIFKEKLQFKKVFVAVGGPLKTDFADALSGAALASKEYSPVILVDKNVNSIKSGIIDSNFIKDSKNLEIITLGGKSLIKDSFIKSIKLNLENALNGKDTSGQTDGSTSGGTSSGTSGGTTGGTSTSTTGGNTSPVAYKTSEILNSINKADASGISEIMISKAKEIGLNLSSFNSLSSQRKSAVFNDFIDNRPESGFSSLENAKTVFEDLSSTRLVIEEELNKVNAAAASKSIDSIKDLSFLTRIKSEIESASYTKFSGYVIIAFQSQVDSEYRKLQVNKEEKLNKLIAKSYNSYSEMINALYDINSGK